MLNSISNLFSITLEEIMGSKYQILNEKGNFVTEFDSSEEATNYLEKNSDNGYKIKEKKSLTWLEWLTIGVSVIIVRFFGLIGGFAVVIGYFLYKYLSKKINKYLAIAISVVAGLVSYLIFASIFLAAI